ncbi:MAG TPA: DUF2284 domain-containing protein [Syntrophales bacterium]|jgi:predicted metal-binding protein|nr:DUF2284 domain-containing protein [Syntrophales bacterium]HON23673.1 DUF2284 domain-containing protein [Syntrophales bacterium]HOU78183.1 DUF2284 domain-containing protein [Syntrophales bacterium]HQG34682.1 DUF2284 domain-containing protein [Syntrophales bacterium]HQI36584.1 DUF2284 domain-containing protein [Syntrophales bacterium]
MNDEESPERGKRQDPGDAGGELAALIALLKGKGATTVRVVSADRIVVDERVRLKCRVPICDSYDRNLMCPPFVMSVAEFRQTLDRYEEALILQVEAEIAGLNGLRPHEDVYAPAGRLHELVNLAEKEAFMAGFRFAAGLIGGCCRLCAVCVAAEGGTNCRFPFRARPSLEAMGIDVAATLANVGLPLAFPVQGRVVWTGLILLR